MDDVLAKAAGKWSLNKKTLPYFLIFIFGQISVEWNGKWYIRGYACFRGIACFHCPTVPVLMQIMHVSSFFIG